MGPTAYALQMLLDPSLADSDNYPLKLSDLIVWPTDSMVAPRRLVWGQTTRVEIDVPLGRLWAPIMVDQDWFDYEDEVMYIDPSGSGADETGYCVAKFLNGYIHILALGGLAGGHDEETLTKLCRIARNHSVNHIRIEKNFGDGMYQKVLQPIAARELGGVRFSEDVARSMKEQRVCDRLEPTMANHRIVFASSICEDTETMYQISMMQRLRGCLRHDDRVEAFAGAVQYFVELMGIDSVQRADEQDLAERIREADLFDESLRHPTRDGFIAGLSSMKKRTQAVWGRTRHR